MGILNFLEFWGHLESLYSEHENKILFVSSKKGLCKIWRHFFLPRLYLGPKLPSFFTEISCVNRTNGFFYCRRMLHCWPSSHSQEDQTLQQQPQSFLEKGLDKERPKAKSDLRRRIDFPFSHSFMRTHTLASQLNIYILANTASQTSRSPHQRSTSSGSLDR